MAHQIPPHLAFCTPGQNQSSKQGIIPKISKRVTQKEETAKGRNRNKKTHKKTHKKNKQIRVILNESWEKKRSRQHLTHIESEKLDTYGNHPNMSKHGKTISQFKR